MSVVLSVTALARSYSSEVLDPILRSKNHRWLRQGEML